MTAENEQDRSTGPARATPLADIGSALRRLRMQRGLRQYEAADAAGVTKAMLSAYETGKRRPSLKTLDSLLTALNAHLGDLHRALVMERKQARYLEEGGPGHRWEVREGRPGGSGAGEATGEPSGTGDGAAEPAAGLPLPSPWFEGTPVDVYDLLGLSEPMPPDEERALSEMLRGFLKLLRFMHRHAAAGRGGRSRPFDG